MRRLLGWLLLFVCLSSIVAIRSAVASEAIEIKPPVRVKSTVEQMGSVIR